MRLICIWLFGMLSLVVPLTAAGQECPAVPSLSGSDINSDTKASLGAIPKLLQALSVGENFKSEIRNVFIEHPETMQYYVVLVAYHDGCIVIRDDKTLSTEKRLELLTRLRESIESPYQLTPAATTSPPLTANSGVPAPAPARSSRPRHGFNSSRPEYTTVMVVVDSRPENTRPLTWAERYLRPVPIVITKGNQYWVNVGYAKSKAEGSRKLAELKARYSNYDFALYSPFGRNDIWNIVLASWVSKDEAETALEVARSINPTSFLWRACLAMRGDECVLDHKLKEAMKLTRE